MSRNERRAERTLFVVMCHLDWKEYGRNMVVAASKSVHSFQIQPVPSVPFSNSFTISN